MIATQKQRSAIVSPSKNRLATGFITTMSTLLALCTKHTSRAAKKLKKKIITTASAVVAAANHHKPPRLTAGGAKKLITRVSDKAMKFVNRKQKGFEDEKEFGDGGVWRREILMGDKCQPLDFSGVIYYDGNGKQINELHVRSPRAGGASPLPSYLQKND